MTEYTGTTVASFGTLCGAPVDLIQLDAPTASHFDHAWICRGCGDQAAMPVHINPARRDANTHAGGCRSLPRT